MQRFYELSRDENQNTAAFYVDNDHFPAHFHSTIELAYVESGSLCVQQDGISRTVSAGYLIVNSSYMLHAYDTPEASRSIVVTIPLSAVPKLRHLLSQHRFAQSVADVRQMKDCRRLLKMMADPANAGQPDYINLLSEALLAYLIQKIGLVENTGENQSDLMKRILVYLQEHAAEPITVSQTAAYFGYSAGRFSHIFNERIGCTFVRYVNSLRCQKAQHLLSQGGMPLIDISTACGFSSLRTFHRVYKEFTGETPRAGQAR